LPIISNLSSAFRHLYSVKRGCRVHYYGYPRKRNGLEPWRFRGPNRESGTAPLRERHCAAAVISCSVISAACVSTAPVHILNKVFDFKVS